MFNKENHNNSVSQEGNRVDGDVTGRDKTINNIYNNYYNQPKHLNPTISNLLEKFRMEKENNPELKQFIDDLDYFNTPFEEEVIGLEKKLMNGNRQSFLKYAERSKQVFQKRLYRYQFSESAQKINVYLLALVESYFMSFIYPKICSQSDPEEINQLIDAKIIDALLELQIGEEPLNFTAVDINGMIYFLTGNCHLNWTPL